MSIDVRKVKGRRLTVFDLPPVDPTPFTTVRRQSTVYQGHLPKPKHGGSTSRRLWSQLKLQDWHRYGWHQATNRDNSGYKSYFNRNNTDSEPNKGRSDTSLFTTALNEPYLTSISLPALPTNGRGDPMLRRPTFVQTTPVSQAGDLFKMLNKGKELKPFSFMGDDEKAIQFYRTHYPLLLGKISDHAEAQPAASQGMTQKQLKERLRENSTELRFLKMRERTRVAEKQLLELEKSSDGDDMVTELRHDVFNPMLWTWNLRKYRLISQSMEENEIAKNY